MDGVRDPEIQKTLRMADIKDRNLLVYVTKFKATLQALCKDRHSIRIALVQDPNPELAKLQKNVQDTYHVVAFCREKKIQE